MTRRSIAICLAAMSVAYFLVVVPVASALRWRLAYQHLDLDRTEWLEWLGRRGVFIRELRDAQARKEPWTNDPKQIVARLAGHREWKPWKHATISVVKNGANRVKVVMTTTHDDDDSSFATEYRVDFLESGEGWKIEWAGARWQCFRDLVINYAWTSAMCS